MKNAKVKCCISHFNSFMIIFSQVHMFDVTLIWCQNKVNRCVLVTVGRNLYTVAFLYCWKEYVVGWFKLFLQTWLFELQSGLGKEFYVLHLICFTVWRIHNHTLTQSITMGLLPSHHSNQQLCMVANKKETVTNATQFTQT